MGYLAMAYPPLGRLRLPFSRDQFMLLMAAFNEIMLAVEIYLAHSISGTIVPNEWIPIIFGIVAGVLLLLAGVLALRYRPIATVLANLIFLGSIVVGILGAYFHIVRAILPTGPAGERVTVGLLVWAPPILGPLTFSLVGLIGISAAWLEDPLNSGTLVLFGNRRLSLPYSKTRAYLFMLSMGSLATLISSVLDHARTNFENPWLWIPTAVGVFGTVVPFGMAAFSDLKRSDVLTFIFAMVAMILAGMLGSYLHIRHDLVADAAVVGERLIRGAPPLAPMLFANMGAIGLIILLDPRERPTRT